MCSFHQYVSALRIKPWCPTLCSTIWSIGTCLSRTHTHTEIHTHTHMHMHARRHTHTHTLTFTLTHMCPSQPLTLWPCGQWVFWGCIAPYHHHLTSDPTRCQPQGSV